MVTGTRCTHTAGFGNWFPAVSQPALHRHYLVLLAVDDPFGQGPNRGSCAMRRRPSGHEKGLGMMADHGRHELDVGLGVGIADAVRPRLGDRGTVRLLR